MVQLSTYLKSNIENSLDTLGYYIIVISQVCTNQGRIKRGLIFTSKTLGQSEYFTFNPGRVV